MPEQYREGIRVLFGLSLGLLSWLAARSRILTLFLWEELTTGSEISRWVSRESEWLCVW